MSMLGLPLAAALVMLAAPSAPAPSPAEPKAASPSAAAAGSSAAVATPADVPAPPPNSTVNPAVPAAAPASAPTAVPPTAAPPPSAQARDDAEEDLRPLVDENPTARSRVNVLAWVGAGVTAVLLGVAAFYGASAADKAGDANRLLTYFDQTTGVPLAYGPNAQQYESDVRVGQHDDRVAKGFLITAGVTALASAVLFVVDAKSAVASTSARASRESGGRAVVAPTMLSSSGAGLPLGLGLGWSF